jgi:hypothetical protein
MCERFREQCRVMRLANQEAQRFNHEYIGTEHILLGLVKEGSGVAANVLKDLGIDLRRIRLEVEKLVQSGPFTVTRGKRPLTPRAKLAIQYAIEEARNLSHNHVGTEHLLLGLLREQEGVAAQVLMNLLLELDDVREKVLSRLGQAALEGQLARQAGRGSTDRPLPAGPESVHDRLAEQHKRIRALEGQLATVRLLFGTLLGVLAGALLGGGAGSLVGLLTGGVLALWGRLLPALLAGAGAGALSGWAHLGDGAGALTGALVGSLLAGCTAELGRRRARG